MKTRTNSILSMYTPGITFPVKSRQICLCVSVVSLQLIMSDELSTVYRRIDMDGWIDGG